MIKLNHHQLIALLISTYQNTSWESDILGDFQSFLGRPSFHLSGVPEWSLLPPSEEDRLFAREL